MKMNLCVAAFAALFAAQAAQADTSPLVTFCADAELEDPKTTYWTAGNSIKMWETLHRLGFEAELHTFAKSNHCFQNDIFPGTNAYNYLDIVWGFLTAHNFNNR